MRRLRVTELNHMAKGLAGRGISLVPPNKALQPTPLGVGLSGYAPCGAADLGR